jgi:YidC/Oxa1 family membrane protein insertase
MGSRMEQQSNTRNLLLAIVLSSAVMMGWMALFPPAEAPVATETGTDSAAATDSATPPATPVEVVVDAPRVTITTPNLTGSLSLQGGRIDDLSLANYAVTLGATERVRLLSPVGEDHAYYAVYGWSGGDGVDPAAVPGPDTLWSVAGDPTLTPDSPVTLTWDNGAGQIFSRTYAVDQDYLFTITQSVTNSGATAIDLAPYGLIVRNGREDTPYNFILHEGLVRMSDGELQEATYDNLTEMEPDARRGLSETIAVAESGWIGFTDNKYWMAALVPESGRAFRSTARFMPEAGIYQAETVYETQTVAPGTTATVTTRLFAGAKEWEVIRAYQNDAGIAGFLDSIDWGWFFFLTKPMFWVLHQLNALIGNMGWSIIALTFVLKLIVLPLAYKSYVSMARMKELQPEMEKLKEKAGDDRQALQQGMMKLYRDNKVNPAAGCLPILIQIPIFFSLYKVIFVTLELRHAPWWGWIRDLSAPDPSSIINLFGLLPWGAPAAGSLLSIIFLGILPLILGVSMWLQQKLNPAPTDPTQKMVFAWMPWVFMFMMGSFASGLIIYWITNNVISFSQQYLIMRSHGHRPDVFGNIRSAFRRAPATANSDKSPGGK